VTLALLVPRSLVAMIAGGPVLNERHPGAAEGAVGGAGRRPNPKRRTGAVIA
jgi:hypothetical protein